MLFAPGFTEREPVRAFLQEQIFGLGPPLDPAIMAGLVDARVRETELTGFSTPTLAVIGQHDSLFDPAALKEALAQIPGARVVEFGDSGHLSFFEEPVRFNQLVQEFVERHLPAA
jgi:pimeloyl-ACP methyl ester carboxylesterase